MNKAHFMYNFFFDKHILAIKIFFCACFMIFTSCNNVVKFMPQDGELSINTKIKFDSESKGEILWELYDKNIFNSFEINDSLSSHGVKVCKAPGGMSFFGQFSSNYKNKSSLKNLFTITNKSSADMLVVILPLGYIGNKNISKEFYIQYGYSYSYLKMSLDAYEKKDYKIPFFNYHPDTINRNLLYKDLLSKNFPFIKMVKNGEKWLIKQDI